jgi:uncharacterized protein (TIGR02231 family)
MMRAINLMVLALLSAGLGAAETAVQTAPAEVTVFPQGAQVLRLGSAQLAAGEHSLVFDGLPLALVDGSLRLSVEGPAGTKVYGLTQRKAFEAEEVQARRRALAEKLQGLKDERDDLSDRVAARLGEAEILKAVGAKEAGRQDAKGLAGLAEGAAAVGRRLAALGAANRKDQRSQRALDARIKAVEAELAGQGPGSRQALQARADLKLASPGTVTVRLSYQVQDAWWSPRYDLRLDADAKEPSVEVELLADVRQTTQEDWRGVKLALSTAQPSADSRVPDPTNWWLDYVPEIQAFGGLRSARKTSLPMAAPKAEAAGAPADASYAAEADYAVQRDLGPATLFEVGRKQDIPSDGSAQRVAIHSGRHPAELGLVVVPRLSPNGFVEAKVRYQGPAPILPGPAQLFRDGALVGQVEMGHLSPGEELALGFGQDERIKAERKPVEQKGKEAGWFGGKDRRRYAWSIKVSNFHQGPRSIEVREQLPRSRQDAIKVEALKVDPKALPEDAERPGLQVWKLDLAAGASATIKLDYEVRWPEGKRVSGLE